MHSVILDEFHYMNDRERGTVWEVEKQKKRETNAKAKMRARQCLGEMLTYAGVC